MDACNFLLRSPFCHQIHLALTRNEIILDFSLSLHKMLFSHQRNPFVKRE